MINLSEGKKYLHIQLISFKLSQRAVARINWRLTTVQTTCIYLNTQYMYYQVSMYRYVSASTLYSLPLKPKPGPVPLNRSGLDKL